VPFAGSINTTTFGINAGGQIVGAYDDATGTHGFLDNGGVFSAIDVPFASSFTQTRGINASGLIVGSYNNVFAAGAHGFLDNAGTFSPLDAAFAGVIFTDAIGINDVGQIVGDYGDATGTYGFLDNGGIFSAIDVPFTGGTATQAWGINEAGQIVGIYMDAASHIHGFLATPAAIPEPSSLYLIGSALAVLAAGVHGGYRRRSAPTLAVTLPNSS
jgi:uncharacterized membrane protein